MQLLFNTKFPSKLLKRKKKKKKEDIYCLNTGKTKSNQIRKVSLQVQNGKMKTFDVVKQNARDNLWGNRVFITKIMLNSTPFSVTKKDKNSMKRKHD